MSLLTFIMPDLPPPDLSSLIALYLVTYPPASSHYYIPLSPRSVVNIKFQRRHGTVGVQHGVALC